MNLSAVKIVMMNRDETSTEGEAFVKILSEAERDKRANSFFWKFFLGGLLAVIIPPHVLYPLAGLIVGFIGRKFIRKQRYIFLEGKIKCPDCHSEQVLPQTNEQFPYLHFCAHCSSRTEISCPNLAEPLI